MDDQTNQPDADTKHIRMQNRSICGRLVLLEACQGGRHDKQEVPAASAQSQKDDGRNKEGGVALEAEPRILQVQVQDELHVQEVSGNTKLL